MQNKRASVEVGVMVVITLLLFIYLFFATLTHSSKVSDNFNSVSYLNNIYAEQDGYENTLYFKLTEDFLNSYQKVLLAYSDKIRISSSEDLNSVFKNDLESAFRQVDDKASDNIKQLFLSTDYFAFDGKKVSIGVSSWSVQRNYSDVNITYSSNLSSSVGFDELGLSSFDDIINAYEICGNSSDYDQASACLNVELPIFDTFSSGSQIKLTSKSEYYIDKKMRKIEFLLSFDYPEAVSS